MTGTENEEEDLRSRIVRQNLTRISSNEHIMYLLVDKKRFRGLPRHQILYILEENHRILMATHELMAGEDVIWERQESVIHDPVIDSWRPR